jgi:lipopolysaccharide/colanic/teichoic acid biosynthesis glycosyltransferase
VFDIGYSLLTFTLVTCHLHTCHFLMNIKIIHSNIDPNSGDGLVRAALSCRPLAGILRDAIRDCSVMGDAVTLAIPSNWGIESSQYVISCDKKVPLSMPKDENTKQTHFVISNGRFATRINPDLLEGIITGSKADVVAVNIKPSLGAYRESYRFALDNQIAGCRRLYSDIANHAEMPKQWPHLLIFKNDAIADVLEDGKLSLEFPKVIDACSKSGLKIDAVDAGGSVLDLETEKGLMSLLMAELKTIDTPVLNGDCKIAEDGRVVGKVIVGKNVTIGSKAIVIGPAIIGDNVTVSDGAVVNSCVIGEGIKVPKGQVVQYRFVGDSSFDWKCLDDDKSRLTVEPFEKFDIKECGSEKFRNWRQFSYPIFLKRGLDVVFSSMVLMLVAPLFPMVAIALKINSPGPLFYGAKRQGLGGKEFSCLKFRTMIVDAEKMQDNLRVVNQIDGPQFKMEDDPRISKVGKFLRDTCIDEIPQFINVLKGEMSVVGPRPSPEAENTLCPSWRDVRLSVRPGITGLWQVCRTREPSLDFQEWIHFDTKYVKSMSLKKDIEISWKTLMQLTGSFIKQF